MPELIDPHRTALIAYDVCRRALDPGRSRAQGRNAARARRLGGDDRARPVAGVPVIYTTPVSRADGADVVMLPTDLSAETGHAATHQRDRGHAGGRLPRRNRAAGRGLRFSQAPAERVLRNRGRGVAAYASARHHHHRRRRHQSRRGDQRARGLQPRHRDGRGAGVLLGRRRGRARLQPRQGDEDVRADPALSIRWRRCCGADRPALHRHEMPGQNPVKVSRFRRGWTVSPGDAGNDELD